LAREGQLAPRLNVLVKKETCAEVASEIGVGLALLIGRSETISGGRQKVAILGDAMEAIIAAIYVDGGLKCARTSILKVWGRRLDDAPQKSFEAKSFLQEWAQARGMQPPIYQEIQRTGPDHAPVFNIKVFLENGVGASGTASSKRAAEQEAAKNLLKRLSK
jgi:ribonuclease-3